MWIQMRMCVSVRKCVVVLLLLEFVPQVGRE